MSIQWKLKKFSDLTPYELYEVLKLRSEVFVVEQNCIFLDMDNIDQQCDHLSGYENEKLIGYCRLIPPGIVYNEASIGRVVTSPSIRKTGIGKELMQQAIRAAYSLFGNTSIKIGAQLYLKRFYSSFGFEQISNVYLEDGIKHIYMQKISP